MKALTATDLNCQIGKKKTTEHVHFESLNCQIGKKKTVEHVHFESPYTAKSAKKDYRTCSF